MATTERSGIGCTARTIAGLNSWQFDKLFYVSGWPYDFRSEYYAADDRGDFSEMVAALDRRVEHFIRTGA
jgi:hypothetical protein